MGKMEEIVDSMAAYVCDYLCMYGHRTDMTQDELEDICTECEMGGCVCEILNEHNSKINGASMVKTPAIVQDSKEER